jgi:hypothetical protein
MSDEMNGMFETQDGEATPGARSLEGTARLTQVAGDITSQIFRTLEGNMDEHREQVAASQKSHGAMDQLIKDLSSFDDVDVEFIRELPEETVNAMLKSQQSKRSRTKSKTMTLDNYRSMMVGAVAENLIRYATGKVKLAGGARRAAGDIGFSDEQLAFLAENQDELKRELRNIQSKKSIAKSKDGFSEEDEHWVALLEAEAALKAIRVSTGRTKVVEVDKTKDALTALLSEGLKPAELAKRIAELAADEAPAVVEEPTAE